MLRGSITRVPPPQRGGRETERRQHDESSAPSMGADQPRQCRCCHCESDGQAAAGQSVRECPAPHRKPVFDACGHHWKNRGMRDTDQKLDRDQCRQDRRSRSHTGGRHHAAYRNQYAPRHCDERQRLARPDATTPNATGELEQGVAERECRHHPTPLDFGQTEVRDHARRCDREIAAQQVGHEADHGEQQQDTPADEGRPAGRRVFRRGGSTHFAISSQTKSLSPTARHCGGKPRLRQ